MPNSYEIPLKKAIRLNNQALNPAQLKPGDLILIHKKKPKLISKIIIWTQRVFAPEDAKWHHVVVSGGGFEICEATFFSGVKCKPYWKYMDGNYDIRVRRLPGIDDTLRYRMAYYAASYSKESYNYLQAAGIFTNQKRDWRSSLPFYSRGIICSGLFVTCCLRVGKLICSHTSKDRIVPAQLSATDQLEEVDVDWLSLDGSIPIVDFEDGVLVTTLKEEKAIKISEFNPLEAYFTIEDKNMMIAIVQQNEILSESKDKVMSLWERSMKRIDLSQY